MATSSTRAAGNKTAKSRSKPGASRAVSGPRAGQPEVPAPTAVATVPLELQQTGKAKAAREKAADRRTREQSPFLRVSRPDSIDVPAQHAHASPSPPPTSATARSGPTSR